MKLYESITKADQLGFDFGAGRNQNPEKKEPMIAQAHDRAQAGRIKVGAWQVAPNSKKGAQRRRKGSGWEYRYPDGKGGWTAQQPAAAPRGAHTEPPKHAPAVVANRLGRRAFIEGIQSPYDDKLLGTLLDRNKGNQFSLIFAWRRGYAEANNAPVLMREADVPAPGEKIPPPPMAVTREEEAPREVTEPPKIPPPPKVEAKPDPKQLWAGLKEGDWFQVPQARSGSYGGTPDRLTGGVIVYQVVSRDNGSGENVLRIRRKGARKTIRAMLGTNGQMREEVYGGRFGYASDLEKPEPYVAPAKTKAERGKLGPSEHPYFAEVKVQWDKANKIYEANRLKGPKADKLLEALHAAMVVVSHVPKGGNVGAESGFINTSDPRQQVRRALYDLNQYFRSVIRKRAADKLKESAVAETAAERQIAKPTDTPTDALPRPEPSATISANPKAAELFEHLRNRRVVDSYTINDYPIDRNYRGQMKVSVEHKPGYGWRVVRQTSKRLGGWNKPHAGTYSNTRVMVVEPQGEERGILLRAKGYSDIEGITLSDVTGNVHMSADGRDEALEILGLAKRRWVSAAVHDAAKLEEHKARNAEKLAEKMARAKVQYANLVRELAQRKDQVAGVADPDRLGSQKRKSHDTAERLIREIPRKLDSIRRFLKRNGDAIAEDPSSEIAAEPKTGAERIQELERIQAAKPAPKLTPWQRKLGQFMTPHQIAYQMAEKAGVAGMSVLDPTAGEGRLLKYARELGAKETMGVEIDQALAKFANVSHGSFLDADPSAMQADVLLMNPPFTTGGPDTGAIIGKAILRHWTGKGKAALILPAGPSGDRILAPFQHMVVHQEDLDDDAFKKEGTNVRSRLYVLEKQTAPGRASVEERKAAFEERQENRQERYESLANKNRAKAESYRRRGDQISRRFEGGQPILVGHHSEKRARADQERMHNAMRNQIASDEKAAYYEGKAGSVGTAGISSSDPEAVVKLKTKLAQMEAKREKIKEANMAWKKDGPAGLGRVWGVSAEKAKQIMESRDWSRDKPHEAYELSNLGGNIKRVKDRIAEISREEVRREFTVTPNMEGEGWRIEEHPDDDRIRIFFDGKPSAENRKKLKSSGFRWSPTAGAWQRQLNAQGRAGAKSAIQWIYGEDAITKSLASGWLNSLLGSGPRLWISKAALPVGSIRVWDSGQWQKIAPGKWKPVGSQGLRKVIDRLRKDLNSLPAEERKSLRRVWVKATEFGLPASTADAHSTGKSEMVAGAKTRVYAGDRKTLHDRIVGKFVDHVPSVPQNQKPVAIMMMGGGGAGKGTIKHHLLGDHADFVNMDSDDIKSDLPEYRKALNLGVVGSKSITAIDAAYMVHDESSDVAAHVLDGAIKGRKNVIIDGTGKSADKYARQAQMLKDRGYQVRLIYAHTDMEEAIRRAGDRAQRSGRFVPEAILREAHTLIPGNFEKVARIADDFILFRSERPPVAVWSGARGKPDTIHNKKEHSDFQALIDRLKPRVGEYMKKSADKDPSVSVEETIRRITTGGDYEEDPLIRDHDGHGGVVEVLPEYEAETAAYIRGLRVDIRDGGIE